MAHSPADVPPPTSGAVGSKIPRVPKNVVQGWLALFAVGCLLGGLLSLYGLAQWGDISPADWSALVAAVPTASALRAFCCLYGVVGAAGLWWLLYLLVRPRLSTPLWAVVVLAVLLVLGIVAWGWTEAFMAQLNVALRASGGGPAQSDPTAQSDALRGIVGPLIWIAYFFRSKRVENAFGEVTIQRIRSWMKSRGAA